MSIHPLFCYANPFHFRIEPSKATQYFPYFHFHSKSMKPTLLIGITSRSGDPDWNEKRTQNYLNRLADYGATPVILSPDFPTVLPDGTTFTPDEQGRLPSDVLNYLDGIIFSGGGDVHPKYFNQPMNGAEEEWMDLKRDELEFHLGQAVLKTEMPIFAICRGCQVLNVAAGGGMIQHFDNHRSDHNAPVLHDVTVLPNTRFAQIVGAEILPVNTFHHQGVDLATLAPSFRAVGFAAPDPWLVEAYESPSHPWLIGVQWHPERLHDQLPEGHRRLWDSFVEACKRGVRGDP